ncbi:MAG: PIN domain-containing protein [Actinomycetota bacterium]|nr:PIN domain-containing protein [Actinomycetota bacterium]
MAITHLADTSVLTRLRSPSVRAVLEPLVQAGAVGRAAMSDLEIGFSARNVDEWDALALALDVMALVPVTARHFSRARQVQRLLAEKGLRGRKVPDLLIAAAAEEAGLIVVHYDADFDHIAQVTGQVVEWIAPRGSVE